MHGGEAIAHQGAQSNGMSELMLIAFSGGAAATMMSSPGSEFSELWKENLYPLH
jgi:hypothetical protein